MRSDHVVRIYSNIDHFTTKVHEPLRMAECGCPRIGKLWRTEWSKCAFCGGDLVPDEETDDAE